MTAPPIAPRLEAGVSELGGVAGWMHDKHHLRIGMEKRKLKGASAIMPDLKRGCSPLVGRHGSPGHPAGDSPHHPPMPYLTDDIKGWRHGCAMTVGCMSLTQIDGNAGLFRLIGNSPRRRFTVIPEE